MALSNNKGSAFERHVCRRLSLWISDGQRKDVYWRSAMSGGRATLMLKRGEKMQAQAGDISAIHSMGEAFLNTYFVECKHRNSANLHMLIVGGKGGIVEWWNKACEEAFAHKKQAFLVCRQNYMKDLLLIQHTKVPLSSCLRAYYPQHDVDVYLFEEFLHSVEPKTMVQ